MKDDSTQTAPRVATDACHEPEWMVVGQFESDPR